MFSLQTIINCRFNSAPARLRAETIDRLCNQLTTGNARAGDYKSVLRAQPSPEDQPPPEVPSCTDAFAWILLPCVGWSWWILLDWAEGGGLDCDGRGEQGGQQQGLLVGWEGAWEWVATNAINLFVFSQCKLLGLRLIVEINTINLQLKNIVYKTDLTSSLIHTLVGTM